MHQPLLLMEATTKIDRVIRASKWNEKITEQKNNGRDLLEIHQPLQSIQRNKVRLIVAKTTWAPRHCVSLAFLRFSNGDDANT
jgi:hypothetical protein